MAGIYNLFKDEEHKVKKELKMKNEILRRGKYIITEKLKKFVNRFKQKLSGSPSGSWKLVFEHYDSLVKIWGGSATSKPLAFGISSSYDINIDSDIFYGDELKENNESESDNHTLKHNTVFPRKLKSSIVPNLIDIKRKHPEKTLLASQRDQLMFKEFKEYAEFRLLLSCALSPQVQLQQHHPSHQKNYEQQHCNVPGYKFITKSS